MSQQLVVGITLAKQVAGVCVCIEGDPIEAVTVKGNNAIAPVAINPETGKAFPGNRVSQVDPRPAVALAGHAMQAAIDIIRDHQAEVAARCGNGVRPLFAVGMPAVRRAAVGKGRVLEPLLVEAAAVGALVTLLGGQDVELVHADTVPERDADAFPETLRGTLPKGWRGTRGQDRKPVRAAWAVAQTALVARGHQAPQDTPTVPTPATPAEYVTALRQSVREALPDDTNASPADVHAAAATALRRVPRPTGVPDLTPAHVAHDAVTRAGIAAHLNTPERVKALAESAGQ